MSNVRSRGGKWDARPMKRRRKVAAAANWATADTLELVRLVHAGVPFDDMAQLQRVTGISWEKLARLAQIPARTLSRRQRAGRLRPDESDRVLRLARVFDLTVELFEGDVEAARGWLERPQRALGGAAPLDFASTEVGAREVERVIERLEHGVFT